MHEDWKLLNSCDLYKNVLNYSISSKGNLKYPSGRISKSTGGKKRYHQVILNVSNGKPINVGLHIIVANLFLENEKKKKQIKNPNIKLEVNHKDGDKKNNNKENLEWTTHSENMTHAISKGLIKKENKSKSASIAIIYKNEKDEETQYPSVNIASSELKVDSGTISRILTGKRKPGILKRRDGLGEIYLNFEYYEKILEGEKWKDCSPINNSFKHIFVSSLGNIKNKDTNRSIKGSNDGRYKRVTLTNGDQSIKTSIHRLVALLFIKNPDKLEIVNHKDGNSYNNNVNNLEWCSQQDNCKHAHKMGLYSNIENNKRSYYKLELNGEIIEEVEGCNGTYIAAVASSYSKKESQKNSMYNGYGYCYKEDYKENKINDGLLHIFPNIDVTDSIDYNKLRPYIINKARPVWKINKKNGDRIKMYDSVKDAMEDINKKKITTIYTSIDSKKCSYGYLWEWVDYKDILNPTINYIRIKPNYIRGSELTEEAIIEKCKLDKSKNPDIDMIRRNFQKTNNFRSIPVWKIDKNGKRVKKYDNINDAEKLNNLSRNCISDVVRGNCLITNCWENNEKVQYTWELATIYKCDDDDYRKIPISDRMHSKRKVGRKREYNIEQRDDKNNLIKIWNNRRDIKKELEISISMSNNYTIIGESKYIFNYLIIN